MKVVLTGLLLSLLLAAADGTTDRYAWVTIFYEVGNNDDEYFLGARVLMQSIKASGTAADRVVLVAKGTQERYIKGFEKDGCIVKEIPNINSPWGDKTPKRFQFALNKLAVWNMVEYKRVIFLDADVIVVQPADFLFKCGHFCAVFFNPINFHTAILVIKPSMEKFNDLLASVKTMGSFDGADQGFINSYFKGLNAAKEWTKGKPESDEPMNRLPVQYNMHHIYYYEKMSWGGVWGGKEEIVTLTYPIAPGLKPWYWWCYPLMDMHWEWLKFRVQIESVTDFPIQLVVLALLPAVHYALTALRSKTASPSPSLKTMLPLEIDVENTKLPPAAWFVWGRSSCLVASACWGLWIASAIGSMILVPGITIPSVAWPVFLSYHTLFFYHSAAYLWTKVSGHALRVDPKHVVLYFIPWIAFFAAAAAPVYPHGIIKLVSIVGVWIFSICLLTAVFKMAYDMNIHH